MSKYCPNCGTELPDNVKFCGKCGQELTEEGAGPRHCANCGAELRDGFDFCMECGQKIQQPAVAAPVQQTAWRADSGAVQAINDSADPRVKQILSRYGAGKMIGALAVITAILVAMWVFYLRDMVTDSFTHFFCMLFYPMLAFMLASSPSSYGKNVRNELRTIGYTPEQTKRVLNNNPFWFKNFRAGSVKGKKKLRTTGGVLSFIGWVFTLYGLAAIVLPVTVAVLMGQDSANFALAEKGSMFLTAGLVLLTAGNVYRTAAGRFLGPDTEREGRE